MVSPIIVVPWNMSDLPEIYKKLLASDDGDIIVKLKDGKQLKIISFLIKERSPVFKTMLESRMQEAAKGVVDLSSQYSLEAFREFMAYIYYNKLYTGSFVPLLFEILCIADYYEVDAYRTYISGQIVKLIASVPVCLMIASEALKHGTLTADIYTDCLQFLVEAVKPQKSACYDETSRDSMAWCCSGRSTKKKDNYHASHYNIDGQVASVGRITGYTQRCCVHGPSKPVSMDISELPDFIVDDVNSAKIGT
ncbi:hypothetical protein BGZ58_002761 [Dissophora ornata]|nr:hypothetical protein BGZ58_002761 [Dissophora ornata]